jgi:predicted dithiol-disulfide oxidoreductase (DUF899 family)
MSTATRSATAQDHAVVPAEQWLQARVELLAKEKELRRQMDEIARLRRELPWERVENNYVFETSEGKKTLAELFECRSQLMLYHFMFGPDWEQGCSGCSFLADHVDGAIVHLAHRDVTWTAVSRAPLAKIEAFKKRMGWKFRWISSFGSGFNFDYHVSFTQEQMARGEVYYNYADRRFPQSEGPGISVFYRDEAGQVFHTYSAYARGLDILLGTYNYLDFAPKGRDEESFQMPMTWVRHHDRYEDSPKVSACECPE